MDMVSGKKKRGQQHVCARVIDGPRRLKRRWAVPRCQIETCSVRERDGKYRIWYNVQWYYMRIMICNALDGVSKIQQHGGTQRSVVP